MTFQVSEKFIMLFMVIVLGHYIRYFDHDSLYFPFVTEKPEEQIVLPPQHFFLSYSPLGGTKKYRPVKTGTSTRNANAKTGSQYFQTLVDVFRRTGKK